MKILSTRPIGGETEFLMTIGNMRKAEWFVFFPIDKSSGMLPMQSHHRWAEMNTKTGEIKISARAHRYATFLTFLQSIYFGTIQPDKATAEQLEQILKFNH